MPELRPPFEAAGYIAEAVCADFPHLPVSADGMTLRQLYLRPGTKTAALHG